MQHRYYNPNTKTYQSFPSDASPQYFNPSTGGYYPTVTNTTPTHERKHREEE